MALITCPDCAARISDLAPACPHCSRPADVDIGDEPVQPIELTAKHWKAMRLRGWAMALGGALLAGLAPDSWSPLGGLIGWSLCLWGIVEVVLAGFGAWWHHG